MLICLRLVSGCFGATMAKLSTCDRDHLAHKAENMYYVASYRECLQVTDLILQLKPSPSCPPSPALWDKGTSLPTASPWSPIWLFHRESFPYLPSEALCEHHQGGHQLPHLWNSRLGERRPSEGRPWGVGEERAEWRDSGISPSSRTLGREDRGL